MRLVVLLRQARPWLFYSLTRSQFLFVNNGVRHFSAEIAAFSWREAAVKVNRREFRSEPRERRRRIIPAGAGAAKQRRGRGKDGRLLLARMGPWCLHGAL